MPDVKQGCSLSMSRRQSMAQVTLGSQLGFATDVNLHSHNIMLDIDAPHNAITRKVTGD